MDNIRALIESIDEVAELMYQNKVILGFKKLSPLVKNINETICEFIKKIPEYNSQGAAIPEDVIINQLKNLLEGIEYKDVIMVADTLQYEIENTLALYSDIQKQELLSEGI